MKIIVFNNNYNSEPCGHSNGWYLVADSAMTNTGKPFYLPENLGDTEVALSMAIKISRLGKNIDSKFSSRYYSELAPALHFRLPDYETELKSKGLATDASHSFDKSLFIGDFVPMDSIVELELRLNGDKVSLFDRNCLNMPLEDVIHKVSRLNTLKIGDIILPGLGDWVKIKEGDFLEVINKEERSFHVKIK